MIISEKYRQFLNLSEGDQYHQSIMICVDSVFYFFTAIEISWAMFFNSG